MTGLAGSAPIAAASGVLPGSLVRPGPVFKG